ncbi:polyketide cyclase [Pseudoalteromonas aurantia]|uniref:SRPBCC family protein n=1 Tax=Pseudoalteromonas aurantia TaxID=43654 RepID=UPI00110B9C52|nr:SRPBCC family protein [Pseudoalteromonas aurantia]TMO64510.1 polyketide cyclase [Pseudoalteromonas aurantia]
MLKAIFSILLFLITGPLLLALFIKNSYHVERSVVIEQPIEVVFDYIKYLKNQDHYSRWANIDPNMVKAYRGTDAHVGFVSAWSSEHPDVGVGEQEIIGIKPLERIDYELRFIAPFQATEPAYMLTKSIGDTTQVTWGFQGHMNYPMNLTFLFINFEKQIGGDLQAGLNKLKEILE